MEQIGDIISGIASGDIASTIAKGALLIVLLILFIIFKRWYDSIKNKKALEASQRNEQTLENEARERGDELQDGLDQGLDRLRRERQTSNHE